MSRPRCTRLVAAGLLALVGGCNLHEFFNDDRCYSTADCSDGRNCSANLCVAPGSLGTGRRCWATRDCQPGQTCQLVPQTKDGQEILDQRCLPAGQGAAGAPCTSSLDCQSELRCELAGFSGTCKEAGTRDRGEACGSTADCLAGLACGPGGACAPYPEAYPTFGGVSCPAETGGFRAHFEVPRPGAPLADFFRLPFPSDVRVDTPGVAGARIDLGDFPRPGPTPLGVDLVSLYVDALAADFDGFSAIAPITFRFSASVADASLAGAATLVDVTPGPTFGQSLKATASSRAPRTKYSCPDRVIVEHAAGDVLLPRHRYAVVLRGVTAAAGGMAGQDPDLAAVLSPTRPAGDEALGHAWDVHGGLRTWLAGEGVAAASIQAATVFTVGDPVSTMGKIATAIASAPAPVFSELTVCSPGMASPCGDGGPQRVCGGGDPAYVEIHGRVTLPIFQAGTAPYATPADGGGIDAQAPVVVRTEAVCFALTVPRQSAPAGGWPLAVYAHGTGGSFHSFIDEAVAAQLATTTPPIATLSYDGVAHGARKNGSSIDTQNLVFNVLNPRAARDNVLQSAADVLQLFRLPQVSLPASLTGSAITFDPARVVYFGHSQGGNAGHLALAYATLARAAVLSGSGGGVIDGVLGKTSPINIAEGMRFLIGDPLDVAHPAMVIFQTFFDRGDPQVYAPLVIRRPPPGVPTKHVLHTYGVGDTFAPPKTLANITRALGVPLVQPVEDPLTDPVSPAVAVEPRPLISNLDGGDGATLTAGTFQYAPAGYDGHFVALQDAQAIADWRFFLATYVQFGAPHVP